MESFSPKPLSQEELLRRRELFYTVYALDTEELFAVYTELDQFFSGPQGLNYRETYATSFWEWYVYSAWKLLTRFDREKVLWLVQNQMVDAIRLGYHVQNRLLMFMSHGAFDPDQLKKFFTETKRTVSQSDLIVGQDGQKNVTLSDVYKELNSINDAFDSLKYSEFKIKIGKLLAAKVPEHDYAYIRPDSMLLNFLDFLHFLQAASEETIVAAVDAYTQPLLYEKIERGEFVLPADGTVPSLGEPVLLRPEKFLEVKDTLLKNFETDETGQFKDIEGVMDLLEKTAEVFGDPRIRDVYVFNENTGNFEWNSALLPQ